MHIQTLNQNKKLKKEIQKQKELLILQSKQAIVGEMIDYIIHQWKQPINAMKLELINFELENLDNENNIEFVKSISKKLTELNEIISEFRSFFREDTKEVFNLKKEIINITKMIKDLLIKNNVLLEVKGDEVEIEFNKNSLKHIMFILINNSIDAFKENSIDNRKIEIEIKNKTLIYIDNAGGIPKEIQDKIFDYNFTSKKEGTGIGLYMVKELLKKENASIKYEKVEKGSKFIITF